MVLKPTTPQKLAGFLRDPPKSDPVPSHAAPAASAEAVPPEEPPDVYWEFHGLGVYPNTSLKVCDPAPNSGVFVFPIITPPIFSILSTRKSEDLGIWSLYICEP